MTLDSFDATVATVSPSSLTFAENEISKTFTVMTNLVLSDSLVTIEAEDNDLDWRDADLTVLMGALPPPDLSSISLDLPSIIGGSAGSGTVTLTSPAPADIVVALTTSSPHVILPSPPIVTVPADAISAVFSFGTTAVTTGVFADISASYSGVTETCSVGLTPPGVSVSAMTLTPTAIVGGGTSNGIVTLSAPAPSGGAMVALYSDSAVAWPIPDSAHFTRVDPAWVRVEPGLRTTTFLVWSVFVEADTPVTITANYAGSTTTKLLTVQHPVVPRRAMNPAGGKRQRPPARVVIGRGSDGKVTLREDRDREAYRRSRRAATADRPPLIPPHLSRRPNEGQQRFGALPSSAALLPAVSHRETGVTGRRGRRWCPGWAGKRCSEDWYRSGSRPSACP